MYNVLVLGATGFIGGHIAQKALEVGWNVSGLRRDPGSVGQLENHPINWIDGNLNDYSSLVKAMSRMEFVFHAGASYPVDGNPGKTPEYVHFASIQMKNVIKATREAKIRRLIYTSSLTTIGIPGLGENRLADERDLYQSGSMPDNAYYEVKSAMENLALEAVGVGYDIVILNPTLVLGPGDVHISSSEILLMIAKGKARAVPPGVVNIIDARDAAAAHVIAARIGKTGQRYILGGDNYSIREAVEIIGGIADVKPPAFTLPSSLIDLYIKAGDSIPFIPPAHDHLRAHKHWQGYNTNKAQKEFNLKVRFLEETARDSIKWFINQGII
jgi:dihydroflavonol-4-reductase